MECADWNVYTESLLNWSMVNDQGISVEIPKYGRFVSFQVMEDALKKAEMAPGDYFRHLESVEAKRRLLGLPEDGKETRPRVN